jgi:polysaccharide pyruvyl transferase WcaK-like protein
MSRIHDGGIINTITEGRTECIFCGDTCTGLSISPKETFYALKGVSLGPMCHKCLRELVDDVEQGYAASVRVLIGIDRLGA